MSEDRAPHNVLARITGNPHLARAVPFLRPEALHAVIVHCGLQDCGELLALATPEQLAAVLDLDLWRADRPGVEERFDAGRFCEWLEVLVDAGPAIAAERLAKMDVALVIAGLSPNIRVFDPAVFAPEVEPSGADVVSGASRARGVHAEIGGYVIVARRQDSWDAIVQVLLALDEQQPETFHRVIWGCRSLSHGRREVDGLDDLLSDAAQARLELSLGRERRRDRVGFLIPEQARAFLDSARHLPLIAEPPAEHPLFAAYQRSMAAVREAEANSAPETAEAPVVKTSSAVAAAVAGVIDVLRDSGMLADAPRALLSGAQEEPSSPYAALDSYLQRSGESGDAEWTARHQELVFLANVLVAGCSVHERLFTRREAMDAVAATCNLGLVYWPPRWLDPSKHTLVTVFQVGWAVLHREVTMFAAERALDALDSVRTSDLDLQLGLHVLRHDLHKAWRESTPWRVRDRLDVLASLDLPAWAALVALFDECPVMLANVSAAGDRRPHRVDPSAFQFIADTRHIAAVHEFLLSLPEQLVR